MNNQLNKLGLKDQLFKVYKGEQEEYCGEENKDRAVDKQNYGADNNFGGKHPKKKKV